MNKELDLITRYLNLMNERIADDEAEGFPPHVITTVLEMLCADRDKGLMLEFDTLRCDDESWRITS